MKTKPPAWIEKLLARFLTPRLLEATLGDLEEKFLRRISNHEPRWKARLQYVLEGAGFLRMARSQNKVNHFDMFRNNIKIAVRSFAKQKTTSFINVFCLTAAIAFSIPVYLYVYGELNSEYFHKEGATIFLVESRISKDGNVHTLGKSPTPLGPAMVQELPLVEKAVRVERTIGEIDLGDDKKFGQWVHYVDPDFMDVFTFPLKAGDRETLRHSNTVILSDFAATKYFGTEDPIGRTLEIKTGDHSRLFTVGGVTEKYPTNSLLRFYILVPYADRFDTPEAAHDWKAFTSATFIKISNPSDVDQLKTQVNRFATLQNAAEPDQPITSFVLDNLYSLKRHAGDVEQTLAEPPLWVGIILMSTIAILLLSLACFNFMSVSFALAVSRFKEIGIRKVVGISRLELFMQFMTENLLIGFISVLLGVLFSWTILLPLINNLVRNDLVTDFLGRPDLWFYSLVVLLVISFLSGAYPAFYVSRFRPVAILRGRVKFENKNGFMQSILGIQFVIALITMITSLALLTNSLDEKDRSWGYDPSDMLSFHVNSSEQFSVMMKEVTDRSDVVSVSANSHHIGGDYFSSSKVTVNENSHDAITFQVSDSYFKQVGLTLTSGRFPDKPGFVVVNETFIRAFHLSDPVGTSLVMDSTAYIIDGVVADFHNFDFQSRIQPAVMRTKKNIQSGVIVVKTISGNSKKVAEALSSFMKVKFPKEQFNLQVQDELFDNQFAVSKYMAQMFTAITLLALFMSGLALFGLASQRMANRLKEICIRKIFGVPVFKAVLMVNGRFMYILAFAALIATPLSYLLANTLLNSIYAYHTSVGVSTFLIAYGLMFTTLVVTLSGKIYNVATVNPADILRSE